MDPRKRNGLISLCAGCGHQILDRYILRVFPDLEWHAACLKCAACQRYLDESHTCFIKDGKTLCEQDYRRLYAIKCAKCFKTLSSHDHVMRAQVNIYHVQCFRCEGCDRQLLPGDEFTFHEGYLFCTANHERSNVLMTSSGQVAHETLPEKSAKEPGSSQLNRSHDPWWSGVQNRPERSTRVRTILSDSQLHMLRTCYSLNPRPDALLKEQLVEMTGLSPRVIRVWFQNKRCKDKKRSCMARQTQRRTQTKSEEEPFSAPCPASPDGHALMSLPDFHGFSPCWKLQSGFFSCSDGECRQEQRLLTAFHVQPSCAAQREDAPVSTQAPDSPTILPTSPALGK